MSRRLIWVIALLVLGSCSREQEQWQDRLTAGEYRILDAALRQAMSHGELGAVLYGEKPVWLGGVGASDRLPGSYMHFADSTSAELYRQALDPWKKVTDFAPDYSFIEVDMGGGEPECFFCALISHRALMGVIEANLGLFQYVLGVSVTPESLVTALTTPGVEFLKALGDSRILLGVALGYGVENSVAVGRKLDLAGAYLSSERPPFRRRSQLPEFTTTSYVREAPSFMFWGEPSWKEVNTGLGFSSVGEELSSLEKVTVLSREHPVAGGEPVPWFGVVRESPETAEILERFRVAAIRTREVLNQKFVLGEVMEVICAPSSQ